MNWLPQELRYAVRSLVKNPGFSAVVVATLALGIGANAAIFSVVNSVLLRPLPFHDVNRLVHIWESNIPGDHYQWGSDRGFIVVRPGTFFDWKRQSRSFESLSAFGSAAVMLGGGKSAESISGHEIDESFFQTLGVQPELGRALQSDDYEFGRHVVILSHSLWQTRFGSERSIVGKSISLDNAAYVVVGVMPEGFYPVRWGTPPLFWRPLVLTVEVRQSRVLWRLFTFARLKKGVSFDLAQREMEVISRRLEAVYPLDYKHFTAVLTPVNGYLFSQYERLFYILLASVGLVLLIACANVANLLLARASERQREFSVRAALGASRFQLIRQVLTETSLLSGTGAAIGIALALVSIRPILALLPESSRVPRITETTIDWRVLLFTLIIAVSASILFGIVPALRSSRPDLNDSLKEAGRTGSAGLASKRTGDLLIVSEVALSLVLLVVAGLLIRSFVNLMRSNPGFNPESVLAMAVNVPEYRYGKYETGGANPKRARLFAEIDRRLRDIPGAQSATVTSLLPLRHGPNPWGMHIVGKPEPPPDRNGSEQWGHGMVSIQRITPGYFATFGIRLLKGRNFDERDVAGSTPVALINETNARRYWGGEDPIGKTIVLDMTSYHPRVQVVGIVADSRLNALDKEVYPEVFWPMAQWPSSGGWIALKTAAGNPAALSNAVRAAIWEVDPDLAITQATTMHDVMGDSAWRQRLTAILLGVFAGLAAVLAAAGIYGVFSYLISRRTKELGIRIALGSRRTDIFGLVLGSAMRVALLGIAIGNLIAWAAIRLFSSWLYNIQENDVTTMAGASALLLTVGAMACYLPAYRATRVDPLTALRDL